MTAGLKGDKKTGLLELIWVLDLIESIDLGVRSTKLFMVADRNQAGVLIKNHTAHRWVGRYIASPLFGSFDRQTHCLIRSQLLPEIVKQLENTPSALVPFNSLKESLKITLTKPVMVFALDELVKNRSNQVLGKDLQQVTLVVTISQQAQVF